MRYPLCVRHAPLRGIIIIDHHDAVVAAHRGVNATVQSIAKNYFWPDMTTEIKNSVQSCEACHRARSVRRKPAGLLRSFSPPLKKEEYKTLDFIFDLPLTPPKHCAIMVAVEKLSKIARFISLTEKN